MTYNVDQKVPTQIKDKTHINNFFGQLQDCDVFAVILQEVDMSASSIFFYSYNNDCDGKFLKWLEYLKVDFFKCFLIVTSIFFEFITEIKKYESNYYLVDAVYY